MLKIGKTKFYQLVNEGKFEIIKLKKKRLYNLDKFIRENKIKNEEKESYCYCRVSSKKQEEDLNRQITYMKNLYSNHKIITDIGSSLNFKRKGLIELIEKGINGKIKEIIIAHKDRLARIGFELIEMILEKYSDAKIIILNNSDDKNEEVTKDIMAIMNVYVAKINGSRKYKKQ